MWIKICGITCEEELNAAVSLRPDALGFVVGTTQSSRNISIEKARNLIDHVPSSIATIAVTLNVTEIGEIDEYVEYVQLYQDPIISLDAKIIRGYVVGTFDNERFKEIEEIVDMVLIDSGYGTGIVHNWNITQKINETITTPLILAGGLTPENIGAAIREVTPYGVDVSSGVEKNGKKDYFLMYTFIERARGASHGI